MLADNEISLATLGGFSNEETEDGSHEDGDHILLGPNIALSLSKLSLLNNPQEWEGGSGW